MRTDFLCISVLRVASGPRVKMASCGLTLCCFVVYSTRRYVLCLTLCHFVLVFFSPFSIAITSLGKERANLSAFRTFVRFVLVWICRFPLPLGVWEGLRFVIVALPGLFSYLFFILILSMCHSSVSPYTFKAISCGTEPTIFTKKVCSSSSWCLGRAAACDCGTPWTFFLLFLTQSLCISFVNC